MPAKGAFGGLDISRQQSQEPRTRGVVEAAIKYMTRSWWRTTRATTLGDAQRDFDRWCVRVADARKRPGGTVGEVGQAEPLRPLPRVAYPAQIQVERKAARSALLAFEGNHYSVPPACAPCAGP